MKLRILLQSLCAVATLAPWSRADGPAYWDSTVGGNGHAYEYVRDDLSWSAARTAAGNRYQFGYGKGQLATISDAAEHEFVRQAFPDDQRNSVWLGFSDASIEGEWRWIDDTDGIWQDPAYHENPIQTAWTIWAINEPNNCCGPGGDEDYLVMVGDGKWNDGRADGAPFHYLVEYKHVATVIGPKTLVWDVPNGGNGNAYELLSGAMLWPDAIEAARSKAPPAGFKPGHLVTIADAAENEFLFQHFARHPESAGFFLGFTDDAVEGEWRWIDGTPGIWQDPDNFPSPTQTAFVNWEPSAPNDSADEDYAVFNSGDANSWNDIRGISPAGVLVEYAPILPRIVDVRVSGLTWAGEGHSIPVGDSRQLAPLPWSRINQIAITFDDEVVGLNDAVALRRSDGSNLALYGPIVTTDTTTGEVTATWMLEEFLTLDVYTLSVSDTIENEYGVKLDGEWTDGKSNASGDGIMGGTFAFSFGVLPGDANQDGLVNIIDLIEIRNLQGATLGSGEYSLFHDIDTRGSITVADVMLAGVRAYDVLPTAAPASAAAVPEPCTIALLAVGLPLVWRAARKRWLRYAGLDTCGWQCSG